MSRPPALRLGSGRMAVAVLLLSALTSGGCYDSTPYEPETSTLELRAPSESFPADGATLVQVEASGGTEGRLLADSVTFSSTLGSFGESARIRVPVIDGVAIAELVAPSSAGTARVRVEVDTLIRERSVVFVRALPETITVTTPTFGLAAGLVNTTTVTAELRRGSGVVSPGGAATFTAVAEETGASIGRFGSPEPSDASGKVSVLYTAGDTSYRGRVRISATADGSEGPVTGSTVLQITN